MISNATVLSWIVLSPFAILTDVAAICFVCHYKPFYHGSDIMVISLLVAMAMNALLVVPIPAFTEYGYFQWNSFLCKFYVWTFVTFRIAQMLTLSAICFHWSAIFKASSNNQNKGLTYRIKFISVIIWILSAIIGLIPIIGAVPDEFFGEGSCMFLTSDMGIGFTIFIFIFVITCMFLAIISICDVTFLTKCMKRTASVRYGAGRFYIPKKRSDVPGNGSYNAQEKFNQLNFTWDLCRLFCIVIFFCFIGNHLPFAILEFTQATTGFNRSMVQEIILWLILIEALVFPHLLWSCSRRYRHALIYTWRVYFLRRPREEEEDPMSCTLQSYSRKVRDINGYTNKLSDIPDVTRNISTTEPDTLNIDNNGSNNAPQSQEIVLQPIHNGRIEYCKIESITSTNPQVVPQKPQDETNLSTFHIVQTHAHNRSGSGGLNIKMGAADLQRSSSGGSRQEWKEQMRKKHLPPIFTNDSFTAESSSLDVPPEVIFRSEGASGSVHSLYYLSGDYHPDNLNTDSLPRHRLHVATDESESDALSMQYDDGDINCVLGGEAALSPALYEFQNKPTHSKRTEKLKNIQSIERSNHSHDNTPEHNNIQQNCNPNSVVNHSHNQLKNVTITNPNCRTRPVSADEIDIYIYQAADDSQSHNLSEENKDTAFYSRSNFQNNLQVCNAVLEGQTTVREPAEGYNEYDDHQRNRVSSNYHDCPNNRISRDHWSNMVEPILKKNETDDLDVSLTSCDPSWQHLRNVKMENRLSLSHSPFDTETDKGFEEALSVEYESARSMSSLTNDSFGDSIDVSNPFEFADDFKNESFKTQAIVSKSRPTSCSTVESDNPFDYVPIETRRDVIKRSSTYLDDVHEQRPSFSTFKTSQLNKNEPSEDFGDVFLDSELRHIKTSTPNICSPWPAIQEQDNDKECGFESNFDTIKAQHSTSKRKSPTTEKSRVANSNTMKNNLEHTGGLTMDLEPVSL